MTTEDRLKIDAEHDEVMTSVENRRVRAVLTLCGVSATQLDDAHQDVQVRLIEHLRGREPLRNRSAWLAVVASRVAMDVHRFHTKSDGLRERVAARTRTTHSADDRDLAMTIADVLDKLPPEQRMVLVLRFYSDMTVPQMADFMGIPTGTVKSRLHTATGAARSALQSQGIRSEDNS